MKDIVKRITTSAIAVLIGVSAIFTVCASQLGDVNSDSSINGKDVLALRKYIVGLDSNINELSADVNSDGNINGKDVLMLRKYIVKLIDSLGDQQEDVIVPDNELTATVELSGTAASFNGENVTINGSVVTITGPGKYILNGTLSDGQIIVNDTAKAEKVYLYLNGVEVNCSNGSPLFVDKADEVVLKPVKDTVNVFSDSADDTSDDTNACIYSDDDLTIKGEGILQVIANKNNGITSENDLDIKAGTVIVKAKKNAIKGEDSIEIFDGAIINIECEKDAFKVENAVEEDKGYFTMTGGDITVVAGDDLIQAYRSITVTGGTVKYKVEGKKTKLDMADGIETINDECFVKL
ncbi:MAG: carbohydrate-binding domain-containing protein [Clostridia bacterium]|nr:carbohydrate-binding domain-containing protein [Clostridia bacterium]MEE1023806.1 carbohydrate-binding domain-containing protein [Acutalibacteraceae bacterium]